MEHTDNITNNEGVDNDEANEKAQIKVGCNKSKCCKGDKDGGEGDGKDGDGKDGDEEDEERMYYLVSVLTCFSGAKAVLSCRLLFQLISKLLSLPRSPPFSFCFSLFFVAFTFTFCDL